jgi:Uma2 family endonuclease
MAETELHMRLMMALIQTLNAYFARESLVYLWGNMLVFYERGNKRKHISPDIFFVRGVPKRQRDNYLIWRERKAPQLVIELTSRSTRKEDTEKKFALYRDVLKVKEYFLFDPRGDYLRPALRGYRLRARSYVPIKPVNGRLPSRLLGLHLERGGSDLRLWNPATGQWLLTPEEARHDAEEKAARQAEARQLAQAAAEHEAEVRRLAEAEVQRLRREIEELRRRRS